jgi:hypothetical protein
MRFHQKRKNKPVDELKAGGTDYVPPALCPRAAHVSACMPAYVEGTGRAGMHSTLHMRWERPVMANHPILTWEEA